MNLDPRDLDPIEEEQPEGGSPDKPDTPLSLGDREPLGVRAVVLTMVTSAIALLVALGVPIDAELKVAILGFVGSLIPVVLWVLTRAKVTPSSKVVARVTSRGRVVAGEAAEQPTETVVPISSDDDSEEPDLPAAADGSAPIGPLVGVTVRPELLAAHPHHGTT